MKRLKVVKEENCIGCKMCAIYASLIKKGAVDLDSSFIKIVKQKDSYKIIVDYGTKTDYKLLVESCPRNCFEIVEEKEGENE